MENVLEELPRPGRVAVVRLRSLGDCVLTTPALALLKRARKDLRVAVVAEARFQAIFEHNPDVDDVLPPLPRLLRRWHPDLCLNLHGGTRSALLTLVSGARWRAGFGHFRHRFVYNVHIPRAQEILGVERTVHTAEHLASAIFYLGAPVAEIPRASLGLPEPPPAAARPYAVLHPVATAPEKTWPADRFLEVARHLEESGLEAVFIGAAGDHLRPFSRYRVVEGAPLGQLKTLLAGASLFVGNDSGPAHMAAAFGLPSVVIFGPSDPAIWGPWRARSEVVTAPGETTGVTVAGLTVAQVTDALARLRVHA
ncbi:MAG: glycosyltransferase family 9 protein [Bryobacteraceae bacterium]